MKHDNPASACIVIVICLLALRFFPRGVNVYDTREPLRYLIEPLKHEEHARVEQICFIHESCQTVLWPVPQQTLTHVLLDVAPERVVFGLVHTGKLLFDTLQYPIHQLSQHVGRQQAEDNVSESPQR